MWTPNERRSVHRLLCLALWITVFGTGSAARVARGEEQPKGLQLVLPNSIQQASAAFIKTGKYAVIVGVNEYEHAGQGISALRFAVPDAKSVYESLVDPTRGGFDPANVTLLTDETPEKPTNTAIGRALNRLITGTKADDLVVVFFSGHGYEEGGRAYLLPRNADLEALDYSAIERDAFVRQIDQIPAKKVIVILDACHSGGVNRGGKSVGKDAALTTKYYESFTASQGRAYIASSAGGELSWEDEQKGHGVFTAALSEALSGAADTQPPDGLVTLNEVRAYLESRVSDWAGRRGKAQHPQISLEAGRGDIPVALNYSFLQEQSKQMTGRRDDAARLRTGLSGIDALPPSEMAQVLDIVGRYGQGETLSDADTQVLDFTRKLVEGSIDARMFRAGTSQYLQPAAMHSSAALAPRKRSFISNPWFLGSVAAIAAGTAAVIAGGGSDSSTPTSTPSSLPAPPRPPGG